MALGQFELLVDDYERAAHAAEIADDIKIATLVSSRLLALREHVDLNQNTLDAWSDVARMVRNHVKTHIQFHWMYTTVLTETSQYRCRLGKGQGKDKDTDST